MFGMRFKQAAAPRLHHGHAVCMEVLAGSHAKAVRKHRAPVFVGQLDGDDYAVDDPELHRYAFWFRNHDVYRNALSAAAAVG
jgi:hypothetical protein